MPRRLPVVPPSSTPERIAEGLSKIALALKHRATSASADRGLSPTQAQVLTTLSAHGPMRASDLAARLAITLPTVSDSVKACIDKGLVDKQRDPSDGRAAVLALTSSGRKEAAAASEWPDFLVSAVGAMSRSEQGAFLTGLVKMIATLQERGEIPLTGMCITCERFRPHVHADPRAPHHCTFIDAPLAGADLRLDCRDHAPAERSLVEANAKTFFDQT